MEKYIYIELNTKKRNKAIQTLKKDLYVCNTPFFRVDIGFSMYINYVFLVTFINHSSNLQQ